MIYYLVFLVTIKKEQDGSKSSRYVLYCLSLRKQLTFRYITTGFPAKWRLRNECRNSILLTRHYLYPDLSSASDWSCRVGNLLQPIRSTPQIWVVTRHQYGISVEGNQAFFFFSPSTTKSEGVSSSQEKAAVKSSTGSSGSKPSGTSTPSGTSSSRSGANAESPSRNAAGNK